jgi:hypothetical protein
MMESMAASAAVILRKAKLFRRMVRARCAPFPPTHALPAQSHAERKAQALMKLVKVCHSGAGARQRRELTGLVPRHPRTAARWKT